MSSTAFELSNPGDSPLRPDDLFVRSLAVQGGEANIGGETTPFARVVMTGVELNHVAPETRAPRRQEVPCSSSSMRRDLQPSFDRS
jgi:hypothetical protein